MSALASKFLLFWKLAKGPELESELVFHPTRKWRFDFACKKIKCAIELDGGAFMVHGGPPAWQLARLQQGDPDNLALWREFVTVSKLEAVFGDSPLVRQIFVYGNSARAYLLAVIVPTPEALAQYSVDELKPRIADSLREVASAAGLQSYEIPRDFIIETTPWTLENGLLTGIRKLGIITPFGGLAFLAGCTVQCALMPPTALKDQLDVGKHARLQARRIRGHIALHLG